MTRVNVLTKLILIISTTFPISAPLFLFYYFIPWYKNCMHSIVYPYELQDYLPTRVTKFSCCSVCVTCVRNCRWGRKIWSLVL